MTDNIDINDDDDKIDNIINSRYNELHESSFRFRKNPVVLEKIKNEELFDLLFELNRDIIKDYKVNKIEDNIKAIYYKIPINYSKELDDLVDNEEENGDEEKNSEEKENRDEGENCDEEENCDDYVTLVFFIKTTCNHDETCVTIENINNEITEKILIHDKNNMEYIFNFKILKISLDTSHEKWYVLNKIVQFDDDINKINKFKQKLFFKKIFKLFNRLEKYLKHIIKN